MRVASWETQVRATDRPTADRGNIAARDAAVMILAEAGHGRRTARDSLDHLLTRCRIRPEDSALAAELVWGVMRHRLTLQTVLRPLAGRAWERLSSRLRCILLVAAYQMIYLSGVPDFAAVSEAVEQGKREGGRRTAGFVNAVLRSLQRRLVQRDAPGPPPELRSCVPTGPGRYARFDTPVLPDPATDPVAFLSASTSHPEVLVRRWRDRYGPERLEQILRAGAGRPPPVLRANRLKTSEAALASRLRSEGFDAEAVFDPPHRADRGVGPGGVVVSKPASVGPLLKTAAFEEGLFQPQDIAAMWPVWLIDPQPGSVGLDLCAGLGTKSTQAAELMGDRGLVIATDIDSARLPSIDRNAARLGITCVRTVPMDRLAGVLAEQPHLDWILIDAPCSNTGVLGRRPEARYRFKPRLLDQLRRVQDELLDRAASLARPETRLCYSTCSLEPEENEAAVEEFRCRHPQWRISERRLTLPRSGERPAEWRDGGFATILVRE